MLSDEARRTIEALRELKRAPRAPLERRRAAWHEVARSTPLPEGTRYERIDAGGVAAEWVSLGAVVGDRTVLLFHGGGYVSGSAVTHREMAARLSAACAAEVIVVDYRLAPEHPFPAAPDDVLAVYRHLLARGADPARLALCGDSAGGGLVAGLLLRIGQHRLAQPAAAALLSPWLDLEIGLPSGTENAEADPSIVRQNLLECARQYLAGADPRQPLASPLHADPSGFPPLYVNVGDLEVLFDEALAFADRARDAGVEVTVSVGEGLWHVYPAWAGTVPEALGELQEVGAWLRAQLA